MTAEQKAAYWHDQSKTQQKKAEQSARDLAQWSALGDIDAVRQTVSAKAQAEIDALPAAEQAAAAARQAGETAGYQRAQQTYLRPAVQAMLIARTKGPEESQDDATARVAAVLDVLDVTKFVNADNGELDAAKVESFAQSLAPKDSNGSKTPGDPLGELLRRQSTPPPGSGGSIAEMEQRVYDRLKPTK